MVQFGIQNDSGIKKKFMGVDFVEIWSKSKIPFWGWLDSIYIDNIKSMEQYNELI